MEIGNVTLEWKGHSGFFIVSSDGLKIYIDPYKLSAGSGDYNNKADIVLITHSHYDHCSIEDLRRIVKDGTIFLCSPDCQSKLTKLKEKIDIRVIEPGGEIEVLGINIKAVPSYNIGKGFHAKSELWNGYIVDIEGVRIYHAGDTDLIPEMGDFGKVDVALLPVGGTYTMNVEEAVKAAFLTKPGLAVPMHFGSVVGNKEDGEKFVQLCEREGINAKVLELK